MLGRNKRAALLSAVVVLAAIAAGSWVNTQGAAGVRWHPSGLAGAHASAQNERDCRSATTELSERPRRIRFRVSCGGSGSSEITFNVARYQLDGSSARTDIAWVSHKLKVRDSRTSSHGGCNIVGSVIVCRAWLVGRASVMGEFSVGRSPRCSRGVAISLVKVESCLRSECAKDIREIVVADGRPLGCR